MTSAHRPTLDPAKGKLAPETGIIYDRMLPGHTKLKTRQAGQGGIGGILDPYTEPSSSEADGLTAEGPIERANDEPEAQHDPSEPAEFSEGSDSAYESDDEEELRKELEKLREAKRLEKPIELAKPKKRSWADEAVFSNQQTSTPDSHHINDSMRSQKNKKFLKKFIQ